MNIVIVSNMLGDGILRAPSQADFKNLPASAASSGVIQTLLTVTFSIAGAIAVIIVIMGGIRYISSQGDPQSVSKAKNTIIYALVGLVVVISAATIVNFALGYI